MWLELEPEILNEKGFRVVQNSLLAFLGGGENGQN